MRQLEAVLKWRSIVNSACHGALSPPVSLLCRDIQEFLYVAEAVKQNVEKNGGWMVTNPLIPYDNFMFKGCYFVWFGE
jgi:hypothetical protein